jgi:hypothetical protein
MDDNLRTARQIRNEKQRRIIIWSVGVGAGIGLVLGSLTLLAGTDDLFIPLCFMGLMPIVGIGFGLFIGMIIARITLGPDEQWTHVAATLKADQHAAREIERERLKPSWENAPRIIILLVLIISFFAALNSNSEIAVFVVIVAGILFWLSILRQRD